MRVTGWRQRIRSFAVAIPDLSGKCQNLRWHEKGGPFWDRLSHFD